MPTVSKAIVDVLVEGNGMYLDDFQRVVKIVKYTNAWGKEAYGIIYEGHDLNAYRETRYVRNPQTYWEYKR